MISAGLWNRPRQIGTFTFSSFVSIALIFIQWPDYDGSIGNTFTLFGTSIIVGVLIFSSLQWFLSSRHRIISVMAWNNLLRRKRNTALVIAGLLVGSAIVTSSLVIGDSLDATMEDQFLSPLGDTDYYIKKTDRSTGLWVEWNHTRAEQIADSLLEWPEVQGARAGLRMSASVQYEGLGEPMATWYAFDANYSSKSSFRPIGGDDGIRYSAIRPGHVIINEEMADSISATIGDEIEVHWVDFDIEKGLVRDSVNLTVQGVVLDINTGNRNSGEPLLFTNLQQAQEITNKQGKITQLAIVVDGAGSSNLRSEITELVNDLLVAEDAGFTIESDSENGIIAVARTTDLGQLKSNEVHNLTNLVNESVFTLESVQLLQVPLYNIARQSVNVSGLASSSITSIEQSEGWDWYATGSGLSLQNEDGEWWVWAPDDVDDESVRDILLLNNHSAIIAHADGVRHIDLSPGILDQNYLQGHSIVALSSFCLYSCQEVNGGNAVTLALEEIDGNVWLHALDPLTNWSTSNQLVDDSSALTADLAVDEDEIVVTIGDILGSQTCSGPDINSLVCSADTAERRDLFEHGNSTWVLEGQALRQLNDGLSTAAWELGLPNGTIAAKSENLIWVENDGLWAWNGTAFNPADVTLPSAANPNSAAMSLRSERLIVTTGSGVAIVEGDNFSGRLPSQIRIDAVNRVPLTVVGCEGCSVIGFPEVNSGEIYVSDWAGETLSLSPTESVLLRGYIPVIRGQLDGDELFIEDASLSVPSPPGQPSFADMTFGLVSIPDAEKLAGGGTGARSMVLIVGPGLVNEQVFAEVLADVEDWADLQADLDSTNLNVAPVKLNLIEATEDAGEDFSTLFLIFGSFVIFSGILLVMNIFVMLADERKPEMGMARAIGMQRSDIRALFVQEGSLLGLISSAVGSVLGIGVAWILMQFMATAFAATFAWDVVFDWSYQSVLAGFTAGFLVTWLTLWSTSMWISHLNVVAAIRSIPSRYSGVLPWWSILITMFLGLSAICCFCLAFLFGDPIDGTRHAWWLLGGFIMMIAMLPPLFLVFSFVIPEDFTLLGKRFHRPVFMPRFILTILSVMMIFWGWNGDPISNEWEQGPFSFIIMGIFLVAAGVLLLTSTAPLITRTVSRFIAPMSGKIAAVLPTSLAYPMATPFRTAVTMGMFSLVIFAVVILSGYSALFGNYINDMSEEAGGDYEILAFSSSELNPNVEEWDLGSLNSTYFDSIATIDTAVVKAERGDENSQRLNVVLRGFDSNFSEHGGLSLSDWAGELGSTEMEIWDAVLNDDSLVIIDSSLAPQQIVGPDTVTLNLTVGSPLLISDPTNSGINRTVFVAGILKPEASFAASGIYINSEFAQERFDAKSKIVWFSVPDGTSVSEQEFAADEIERGMIEEGVAVFVIEVAFSKVTTFFMSMFNLLKAFLGLGLAVGIAGLAVVTVRNVSERRHQIGILRALGFSRAMVVSTFLVELSWISFLGIFNGAVVGVGFHYALYDKFLRDEGAQFLMPWNEIWLIILGAYLLTLIATVWPVRQASSIRPAEALRDVI